MQYGTSPEIDKWNKIEDLKQNRKYMEAHYKITLALQMREELSCRWNVDLNVEGKM
jgi:hypothetical protein